MKYIFILLLLAPACAISYPPKENLGWVHSSHAEALDEIAYNCSYNATLCKNFIARIDSGTLTKEEIRFFILVNQHAWSETASNIENEIDDYEGR